MSVFLRFCQNTELATDEATIIRIAHLAFNSNQFACPLLLYLLMHLVRHLGCRRATPRAKRKDMYFRKSNGSGGRNRFRKLGIGLARKSHDDIGCNRRPIKPLLQQSTTIDKPLAAPTSSHSPQHGVTPALHRNVQVRRDLIWMISHHLD